MGFCGVLWFSVFIIQYIMFTCGGWGFIFYCVFLYGVVGIDFHNPMYAGPTRWPGSHFGMLGFIEFY